MQEAILKQKHDGKAIIKASYENIGLIIKANKVSTRYYSIFECEVEGRKKPVPMKVFHGYCPFCGKKEYGLIP